MLAPAFSSALTVRGERGVLWGEEGQQHSGFPEGRPCPPLAGSPGCREGEGAGPRFQRGHSAQLLSAGRGRARSQSSSGLVADLGRGRGAQPATCQCGVGSTGLRSINVLHLSAPWHRACGTEAGRCPSSEYFLSPPGRIHGATARVESCPPGGEKLSAPRVKALRGSRPGSWDSWNSTGWPEGCLQT